MVEFIRKATKKSLLAMLRKADKITPRLLARLFEGVLFKDEYETFSGAGGIDHGALGGLADDDHTQYVRHNLSTAANDFLVGSGSNTFVKKTLAETGAILEADIDHGNIQGLADDDHSQYLRTDGTRASTGQQTFNSGIKADTVDEKTADAGVTVDSVLVKDNTVRCGDATNNITLNNDYGVLLNGTTTVWDDLRVPALSVKVPTSGNPGFTQFIDNGAASTGVFLYWFDPDAEEEVYFAAQLPHDYKEGTDIEPHVHWVPADTAAGAGTDVCWGLEYTWANINGTFGNTAIIYGDEQSNGSGETLTQYKHYLTDLGTISGTGKTISSMLVCRLFRDATGAGGTDDYDDDAGLMEFDFHYQADTMGSRTETAK